MLDLCWPAEQMWWNTAAPFAQNGGGPQCLKKKSICEVNYRMYYVLSRNKDIINFVRCFCLKSV